MEVESEEVKPIVEVKVEEKEVVEVKNNWGSAKEVSDVFEKNMVHLWTNGSRLVSMPSVPNGMPTADQLTFFYGGKVFVFEAVPEEKVREILLIASAAAATKTGEINKTDSVLPLSTPILARSPSLQSTASVLPTAQPQIYPGNTPVLTRSPSLCKFQGELPIARRHSLQRFFEKRRDRLVSKNPYPTPPGKTAETAKDVSAEASPNPSYREKPLAREDEIKMEVAGNVA